MPKTKGLTEEQRRRERDAKRNEMFREKLGAYKAKSGVTYTEFARKAEIKLRTLQNRMSDPGTMSVNELRRINDILPEGMKIPAEVIGA